MTRKSEEEKKEVVGRGDNGSVEGRKRGREGRIGRRKGGREDKSS